MSPSPNDTELYEQFLRSIEPLWVALQSCRMTVNRTELWNQFEKSPKGIEPRLSSKYSVAKVGDGYFDLVAALKLVVGDGPPEQMALQIECAFEGHFHGNHVTREFVDEFSGAEAKLLVWPYFRQFISDSTARMVIPPLFIPISFSLGAPVPRRPHAKGGRTHSHRHRDVVKKVDKR